MRTTNKISINNFDFLPVGSGTNKRVVYTTNAGKRYRIIVSNKVMIATFPAGISNAKESEFRDLARLCRRGERIDK